VELRYFDWVSYAHLLVQVFKARVVLSVARFQRPLLLVWGVNDEVDVCFRRVILDISVESVGD
jgi:hypothetical protein